MPDRYSYQNPFASSGQPWFVIGNIEFTTTVTLIAVNIAWMFVYAIEGRSHALTNRLLLVSEGFAGFGGVLGGEVWRLVTWPLIAAPTIWTVIGLVFFYLFGNQLEALMGRRHYLIFIVALTLVPSLMVTFFDAISTGFFGSFGGIDIVQFGILIAFVAQYPTAKFFFGIPAPALIGVFVALQYLNILAERDEFSFVLVTSVIATALIGFKSLGYASTLHWIPSIPLPASVTGSASGGHPTSRRSASPGRPGRRRGRGNLSAVPGPRQSPASDKRIEMEIDALLDQVAERGLDSLTKEQRKRLEDHSKRLRKRRDE